MRRFQIANHCLAVRVLINNPVRTVTRDEAGRRLRELESAYKEIGPAGAFGLVYFIEPLRLRFDSGEDSQSLVDEIMGLK